MDLNQAIDSLTAAVSEQLNSQLQHQLKGLLLHSEQTIAQLQADLDRERQAREAAERDNAVLQHNMAGLEVQLRSADARAAAALEEVAAIHRAIAEQLESAEAEHLAQQQTELAREQLWQKQVDDLQTALKQERFWRELLQARVETLRRAASELFAIDPTLPVVELPSSAEQASKLHEAPLLLDALSPELEMSPAIH